MTLQERHFTCTATHLGKHGQPLVRHPLSCPVRTGHDPDVMPSGCRRCLTLLHNDWVFRNRDKNRAHQRASYARHRQYKIEQASYYRKRNPEGERWNRLRRKYGIDQEQYEVMLQAQAGVCAICGVTPSNRPFHVDHDHESGRIRGLLCSSCNTGIGSLGDDPVRLMAGAAYITAGGVA